MVVFVVVVSFFFFFVIVIFAVFFFVIALFVVVFFVVSLTKSFIASRGTGGQESRGPPGPDKNCVTIYYRNYDL